MRHLSQVPPGPVFPGQYASLYYLNTYARQYTTYTFMTVLGLVDFSLCGCLLTDQNGWQRDHTTEESCHVRKETHISWSWSGRLLRLHPRGTAEADQLGAVFVAILCHLKSEMVGEGWQSISLEALSPYWTQKKPVNMSAAPWHFLYETSWWWSGLHDMGLVRAPWGTETIDPDSQLILAVRGRRTSPAAVVPFRAAGWVGYWLLCTLVVLRDGETWSESHSKTWEGESLQ